MAYLDDAGVRSLWGKATNKFATKGTASQSANGLMSSTDKTKLDGIATGANNYTHPSYTSHESGLYKVAVDSTGHITSVTQITKQDILNLGVAGTDTKYDGMVGASSTQPGGTGLVPAPEAGQNTAFLRGDGTWAIPTNTTYSAATISTAGLMSASDKSKLDGITAGANKYSHPTYTSKASGFYKVTVDGTGHVSSTAAVTKSDITALGIPDTNTTYGVASSSANGLMSSADKILLDAIPSTYIKKSDLDVTTIYKYKGSVADSSKLPTSPAKGDVYDIVAESTYGPAGTNVAWNGTAWDSLGGKFSITAIATDEIAKICV